MVKIIISLKVEVLKYHNIKRSTEGHDEVMVGIETWYFQKSFELIYPLTGKKMCGEMNRKNWKGERLGVSVRTLRDW